MENWHTLKRKKTCPSATLSTTNSTWIGLGSNLGLHVEAVTNYLSNGMVIDGFILQIIQISGNSKIFCFWHFLFWAQRSPVSSIS